MIRFHYLKSRDISLLVLKAMIDLFHTTIAIIPFSLCKNKPLKLQTPFVELFYKYVSSHPKYFLSWFIFKNFGYSQRVIQTRRDATFFHAF